MTPKSFFVGVALLMALPPITASVALWVNLKTEEVANNPTQLQTRRALWVLLYQTLLSAVLIPTFFRNITGPQLPCLMEWMFLAAMVLLISIPLCCSAVWLLAKHGRGIGRVALPALSTLDLCIYIAVFLSNFVTP